jgi:TonB family protein
MPFAVDQTEFSPRMKQIRKAALMIAVVLAALARPTLAQEKNAPSASQAQVSSPYPNTADGLKQFLQDVLAAAKTGDTQKVAVFVKDMEIPNYETWFYKTFPADSAKSWVGPYGANLDRNERSMQELFAQLSQKEGELFARKVNDSPEPGKGLEWGMLQSLRQPVDIYFASWKKPGDATTSRGDRVGYFMFIEGKFRWNSLISFARISTTGTSEPLAAPQTLSPTQPPSVQQSETQGRIHVAQEVSQAMIVSRVPPRYPRDAIAKGVQGKVNMLAVISKTGDVEDLRVIDGDPLLTSAAINAVKQWKYRPYLVQSGPVEMETTISVIFTIAGKN